MNHALGTVVHQLEGLDVTLVQQDLGNGLLHVGCGDVDGVMLGVVRVADTGEHIRNGIGNVHRVIPPIRLQAVPVSAARYRVSPEPTYCRWLGTGPRRLRGHSYGKADRMVGASGPAVPYKLPGSLPHAGDLAFVGQLPEADPADAVVTQVGVGTAADLAPVVAAGGKLGLSLLLELHG